MEKAKKGDKVSVHYKGTLENGTVFDSSEGRDPLEFTLGGGQLIPAFESAVEGLAIGETITKAIGADDAYGARNDELMIEVEKDKLPPDMEVVVGQMLAIKQEDGSSTPVTIVDVKDEMVTLDANHPLAGQDLTFEITLVTLGEG